MSEDSAAEISAMKAGATPRSVAVTATLRIGGTIAALLLAYYLLPLDKISGNAVGATLVLALVVLGVLSALEVRSVLHSPHPNLRAVEALAFLVPLLILLFSMSYFVVAASSADDPMFSETLTRTDALYFSLTVFTTVGFGDITADSEGARALVSFQMAINLLVVGLGLRIITGAVKHRREQR